MVNVFAKSSFKFLATVFTRIGWCWLMLCLNVTSQVWFRPKDFQTFVTRIFFRFPMCPLMFSQVIFGCECFVAYFTSMLILTMGFHMSCKICFWNKETTDLAEAIHYCECCPKLLIVTKISDFIMFYLPNWSIAQSI